MASLPVKLKLAIRDHFTAPTSPLQTTLTSLSSRLTQTSPAPVLGLPILLTPEWPLLLTSLTPLYPTPASHPDLVLSLAGTIQTLARSLAELLDDPSHEAWTELVLEKINASGAGGLRIHIDVGPAPEVGVRWSGPPRAGFVVTVPAREKVSRPGELGARFRGELVSCFEAPAAVVPVTARAGTGEDWDDVEVDLPVTETGKQTPVQAKPAVEMLPDASSLPRPDELFLRAPYYLTVRAGHDGVEVQGSHSPSLRVMSEYFKKWCRVNHHDSTAPPAVQVTLSQSAFGLGEMFDRLSVSTKDTRYNNQFQVTAPMIVAFVEGVLGYELMSDHGGWNFKRETEFKTSRF